MKKLYVSEEKSMTFEKLEGRALEKDLQKMSLLSNFRFFLSFQGIDEN